MRGLERLVDQSLAECCGFRRINQLQNKSHHSVMFYSLNRVGNLVMVHMIELFSFPVALVSGKWPSVVVMLVS